MVAIIVKNLSKSFEVSRKAKMHSKSKSHGENLGKEFKAVDDISFEVEKGEIFGFLGPNGAGKTTTIRMLTGVLKPTNGSITIFGKDSRTHSLHIKQLIGNVPEEASVYADLSGWNNLLLIGELYGLSKEERKNRAEYLLKEFELFEKKNIKAKTYSKGMKQRLLLSMALMSNPEILFLDEPTSGLDVQSARIIKEIILEYNKKGTTIFLTTHDMDIANELCHRIAIINKGKIISLDTPENFKALVQEYQAIDLTVEHGLLKNEIEILNYIKEVQEVNGGYHIIVDDIHNSICEIIDYIRTNNLKIKKLITYQPKLEEAFLKIIERGGSK
jgi:ABC-2 type transport system ATP-binding protein